jgi:hypothetical protein
MVSQSTETAMFKIEYFTTRLGPDAPEVHSELALTKSVEEAIDQAEAHLSGVRAKFGVNGYRVLDEEKHTVATGPGVDFIDG